MHSFGGTAQGLVRVHGAGQVRAGTGQSGGEEAMSLQGDGAKSMRASLNMRGHYRDGARTIVLMSINDACREALMVKAVVAHGVTPCGWLGWAIWNGPDPKPDSLLEQRAQSPHRRVGSGQHWQPGARRHQ